MLKNPLALTKADTDDRLVAMWLDGRTRNTSDSYQRDIKGFRKFFDFAPLRSLKLEDLQAYRAYLEESGLKPASQRRKLNAVKSLYTYATRLNYLPFNVATAIRLPHAQRNLAGRILQMADVRRMLALETDPRNAALLQLAYGIGARVSELCGLTWANFNERDDGKVQVTLLGKGGKERVNLVPPSVWMCLLKLRGDRPLAAPVFVSHTGRAIDRTTAHRIIKQAAERAGLDSKVSFHWLRHAHAQHSLSGGAPLQLVRDSLGHSSIAVTNVYLESSPTDGSSQYLNF